MALSLHARNYALWGPGGAQERLAFGREIVALAHQGGDPELALHGHAWSQMALLELGDVAALDVELAAYERVADELQQPRYRWYAETRRAMRALLAGDLDEGECLARRARELGTDAGEADADNVFGAQMSVIWQERPCREAIDHIDVWCQRAEATLPSEAPLVLALRLLRLGLILEATPTADAHSELDRMLGLAIRHVDHYGWPDLAVHLTAIAVRLSAGEAAATLYELLLPHAGLNALDGGAVTFLGAFSHHLGMLAACLGWWDEADEHLASAAAMHERMGARANLARTRLEWASMLLNRGGRGGDAERARQLVGQALTTARELGLAAIDQRALQLLEQMG
jgi:hypothetical protein